MFPHAHMGLSLNHSKRRKEVMSVVEKRIELWRRGKSVLYVPRLILKLKDQFSSRTQKWHELWEFFPSFLNQNGQPHIPAFRWQSTWQSLYICQRTLSLLFSLPKFYEYVLSSLYLPFILVLIPQSPISLTISLLHLDYLDQKFSQVPSQPFLREYLNFSWEDTQESLRLACWLCTVEL